MKNLIKNILKKNGILVKRYPETDIVRRMKLVANNKIDTLIDIGANAGQYASLMREYGYKGKIISFEPLKNAFEELKKESSRDNNWLINNYALGNDNTTSMINVAGNSWSSSILNMLPSHENVAPESKYVKQEKIEIKKLDSIFNSFCKNDNVMMKIDVQGFEKNVLDGATKSLDSIKIIQLEMSIIPLYENEMLFVDMINYLKDRGFELFSLENGYFDSNTGKLLQVDGIFEKSRT
jgi:FkbM family methyltransferase